MCLIAKFILRIYTNNHDIKKANIAVSVGVTPKIVPVLLKQHMHVKSAGRIVDPRLNRLS